MDENNSKSNDLEDGEVIESSDEDLNEKSDEPSPKRTVKVTKKVFCRRKSIEDFERDCDKYKKRHKSSNSKSIQAARSLVSLKNVSRGSFTNLADKIMILSHRPPT